ncbi:hypothetical protein CEXT_790931, partial [Caerostris extrusa]
MKTEVFMGGTPGMGDKTNIHAEPKAVEDPVTILLLDTPQNTPVGTPGSDNHISSEMCTLNADRTVEALVFIVTPRKCICGSMQ